MVLWFWRLCTNKSDADRKIEEFRSTSFWLVASPGPHLPIFLPKRKPTPPPTCQDQTKNKQHLKNRSTKKGLTNSTSTSNTTLKTPKPVPSKSFGLNTLHTPLGHPAAALMENRNGDPCGINKLVIAYSPYSRPLNLRNRFSVR
jgi:hypothetical protein